MAIVFEHDFEDNSLATWDTNDGSLSPTIQTSVVYEGARALRSHVLSQQTRLIKNLTSTPTATIRSTMLRPSPHWGETLILQSFHNDSFDRGVYMQFWDIAPKVRVVASVSFVDTDLGQPTALVLDAWEELQLGVDATTNPWVIKLWRNGSLVLDTTFAQAGFGITRATIGAWVYSPSEFDIYHDKVQISNTIGLIADEKQSYYATRRRSWR